MFVSKFNFKRWLRILFRKQVWQISWESQLCYLVSWVCWPSLFFLFQNRFIRVSITCHRGEDSIKGCKSGLGPGLDRFMLAHVMFPCAWRFAACLAILVHIILAITLWGSCCQGSHFTGKAAQAVGGEVIFLRTHSWEVGSQYQSQAVWPWSFSSRHSTNRSCHFYSRHFIKKYFQAYSEVERLI